MSLKTSEPDKSIPAINIPELADDFHPERFLRFDKFPVKEIDQHMPHSRMKRILPELDNWAARLFWHDAGNRSLWRQKVFSLYATKISLQSTGANARRLPDCRAVE